MARSDDVDSTPNASCIAAQIGSDGFLYSLVVITDWESYSSFVYRTKEMEQDGEVIYEYDNWITTMWVSEENAVFLGDVDGNVHVIRDGNAVMQETPAKSALNDVFGFSERFIVLCGDSGTLLKFDGHIWSAIETSTDLDLYSVSGNAESNLYIVGEQGCVLQFDGNSCRRIELSTNVMLNAVLVLDDGRAHIVSEKGVIFSGGGDVWVANKVENKMGLFTIDAYRNHVLIGAGTNGIYELVEGELIDFKTNVPAYGIRANGSLLAVRANNFAVRHDGETWKGKTYDP